jgi:predicted CXXCH cytochrome family protein
VKQLHCDALFTTGRSKLTQEKTVKIIFSIAAALALASAAPALAAGTPPAEPKTLKGDKQPAVTFNHKTHPMDCTKCHADAKGGKIEGLVNNKEKGHGLCLECHKTQAKGPTKCAECHKKA